MFLFTAWLSFRYFGKTYANLQEALYFYVDSLVRTNINEDVMIGGRSRDFVYIRGAKIGRAHV